MIKNLFYSACILLPSCIVITLLLIRVPYQFLLQFASILVIVLLFFIYLIHTTLYKTSKRMAVTCFSLTLSVFIVEIVIILTGGIYSPFLILIYISLIVVALLFAFPIALLFLLSILLTIGVYLTQDLYIFSLINDDPVTLILYIVSLFAIIPIVEVISSMYHRKESLSNILSNQLVIEESIINGIAEMVFVVDEKGIVFSANHAVKLTLGIDEFSLVRKNVFDFLILKNAQGQQIVKEAIPFDDIFIKNTPFVLKGLQMITKTQTKFVDIKVLPTHYLGEHKEFSIIVSEVSLQK